MYGMPGLQIPQIVPYQSAQFYNNEIKSKHRHKHKRREMKKHRSHKHESRDGWVDSESSSAQRESASDSEDTSSDECSCDLTCDQCSTKKSNCCDVFCGSCMSQAYMLYPVPYPILMAHPHPVIVPPIHTNYYDSKDNKDKNDNAAITTEMPEKKTTFSTGIPTTKQEDITTISSLENINSSTVKVQHSRRALNGDHIPHNEVAKIVKSNENEIEPNVSKNVQDHGKNSNTLQHYFNDIIFKIPHKGKTKYMLTSLRRIKENCAPKYGVVPVPENVATVLLTNLRSLKSIQSIGEPQANSDPTENIRTPDNLYGGTSGDAIEHKTNSVPQDIETLYVHETGSGLTIEGPLSAIQSLNRRLVETMKSGQNKGNQNHDALPVELVKKLYRY
ncbi:hypothetical protein O0L34_g6201 [Tuta absoluta]|nr:hypothetical protein O0L34_g6201 [Tuta absoluta]